jgi:hypothetical protein
MEMSGQFHAPAALFPNIHCIVGCIDPSVSVDDIEKK